MPAEEQECQGCRTARGECAADEVYRDERVVAVVALHAINPGHLVVVTNEHVRNALTMEADLLCHMMVVARALGIRLRETLECPGIMLVFNNEAPCQSLFHAHLHVVPREHGDEMDIKFGEELNGRDRAAMAAHLRPMLAAPLAFANSPDAEPRKLVRIQAVVEADGELHLTGLPFRDGDKVQVILRLLPRVGDEPLVDTAE